MLDCQKNIEDFDFVVVDVETTGLSAIGGDSICEIAGYKVRNRQIIDTFYSLVNPRQHIPYQVYKIHNISDESVKDAPCFKDIALKLVDFLKGSILCSYNIEFDLGFINSELSRINQPFLVIPTLDILRMARKTISASRYNLGVVARVLNIEFFDNLHRAKEDARVTVEVFFKILDILKSKDITSLAQLRAFYGENSEVCRFHRER